MATVTQNFYLDTCISKIMGFQVGLDAFLVEALKTNFLSLDALLLPFTDQPVAYKFTVLDKRPSFTVLDKRPNFTVR